MDFLFESLKAACFLIVNFDRELLGISWRSVWIALSSTTLACGVGVPLAMVVAVRQFRGKRPLLVILNTLMAFPTVVAGLLVYSFLCRRGALGDLELLYTPCAMIIGQWVLATPLIMALTVSVLQDADERIGITARTLGASRMQALLSIAGEARTGVIAAVVAGFGRVFAEVGVSMMLGGNIKNYTRNITTAIAFETSRGEFALALALGIILLLCALAINLMFQALSRLSLNRGAAPALSAR